MKTAFFKTLLALTALAILLSSLTACSPRGKSGPKVGDQITFGTVEPVTALYDQLTKFNPQPVCFLSEGTKANIVRITYVDNGIEVRDVLEVKLQGEQGCVGQFFVGTIPYTLHPQTAVSIPSN